MPADSIPDLSPDSLNLLIEKKIKESIIVKVNEAFDKARSIYQNHTFIVPEIRFDLKGNTAGYACFNYNNPSQNYLRFNLDIARSNLDAFLNRTPAHEVAHIVAYKVFGRDIQPHGWQWQMIATQLGCGAERCHNFKTVKARKTNRYVFNCSCGAKCGFGANIRSKIELGHRYFCKRCKSTISLDKVIQTE